MCYAVTEHRSLTLPDGRELIPGELPLTVDTDEARYQVAAVDHAVLTRTDCTLRFRKRVTWIAAWQAPELPDETELP